MKHLHLNEPVAIFCLLVWRRLWIEPRFRQRTLHSFLAKWLPALVMTSTLWTATEVPVNVPGQARESPSRTTVIAPLTVHWDGQRKVTGTFANTWSSSNSYLRCRSWTDTGHSKTILRNRLSQSICSHLVFERVEYSVSGFRFVLYLSIYIAPLAVHTNERRSQCERPR